MNGPTTSSPIRSLNGFVIMLSGQMFHTESSRRRSARTQRHLQLLLSILPDRFKALALERVQQQGRLEGSQGRGFLPAQGGQVQVRQRHHHR